MIGYGHLHTAIDDHSRLAHTEILPNETKETATAFWRRAHRFFTDAGITVRQVLTDNGACYRSHHWRDQLAADGITHKRTPYRAPDQRQSRALPPHPPQRMGLRPPLHQRNRTTRRTRPPGCTSTTTTADTPHWQDNHRQPRHQPFQTQVELAVEPGERASSAAPPATAGRPASDEPGRPLTAIALPAAIRAASWSSGSTGTLG